MLNAESLAQRAATEEAARAGVARTREVAEVAGRELASLQRRRGWCHHLHTREHLVNFAHLLHRRAERDAEQAPQQSGPVGARPYAAPPQNQTAPGSPPHHTTLMLSAHAVAQPLSFSSSTQEVQSYVQLLIHVHHLRCVVDTTCRMRRAVRACRVSCRSPCHALQRSDLPDRRECHQERSRLSAPAAYHQDHRRTHRLPLQPPSLTT